MVSAVTGAVRSSFRSGAGPGCWRQRGPSSCRHPISRRHARDQSPIPRRPLSTSRRSEIGEAWRHRRSSGARRVNQPCANRICIRRQRESLSIGRGRRPGCRRVCVRGPQRQPRRAHRSDPARPRAHPSHGDSAVALDLVELQPTYERFDPLATSRRTGNGTLTKSDEESTAFATPKGYPGAPHSHSRRAAPISYRSDLWMVPVHPVSSPSTRRRN